MLTNSKASDGISEHLKTHIEGLAYIGIYVGHKCELFSSGFDAKALVTAAQKRWNYTGEYRWQIPPRISEAMTAELSWDSGTVIATGLTEATTELAADTIMELPHQHLLIAPAQEVPTIPVSDGVYTTACLTQTGISAPSSNNHSG